jgi:outer membrane protein assembly factor BamB
MVVSSPAVANGVVYVGSYDHLVYAFGSPNSQLQLSESGSHSVSVTIYLSFVSVTIAAIAVVAFLYTRKRRLLKPLSLKR